MPNHVTNQITFGSDAASLAAFQHMLHELRGEGQPLGSIDFNKLIPMPPELRIECGSQTDKGLKMVRAYHNALDRLEWQKPALSAEEYAVELRQCEALYQAKRMAYPEAWELGEKAYQNIQKYGVPTWYEWSIQHWGTKWNAYQCRPLNEKGDTMEFLTANGSVPRLVAAMSRKYPDQEITYRWADEDLGHNVGEIVLKNGEEIEMDILPNGSRAAYEMAEEITGVSLADCGLSLTADEITYERREDPPPGTPKHQKKAKAQRKDR